MYTLSPRLLRNYDMDNLVLDRLLNSAIEMLEKISVSGEQ